MKEKYTSSSVTRSKNKLPEGSQANREPLCCDLPVSGGGLDVFDTQPQISCATAATYQLAAWSEMSLCTSRVNVPPAPRGFLPFIKWY